MAKLTKDERALIEQVSVSRLEEFVINITRKVRLSGSPEERETFRYIRRTLKGWGLEIEEHHPVCWTSWPVAALLELIGKTPVSVPCITHSMAASTPTEGVVLELVDVGRAEPERLEKPQVTGRAVLCDGHAMPGKVFRIEQAGAAAQIHVCGELMHEMITSIVWGSPTPENASLLPTNPIVSVNREGGARLREALGRGPTRIRLRTRVDTRWRALPLLIAHLRAPRGNGDFVLMSGHVDSWHYGAMDNGSGNAAQLEVGRIFASRKKHLKRDLRLAFWSGHSHARYGGSAWYADQCWRDLHEHCVLHVNADCVGAKGATLMTEAMAMAETRDFGSDMVEKIAGQRLSGVRPPRAADQSFWGHGIPSLFMSPSEQPADGSESARAYAQLVGGATRSGGLGWWWHTPEDTLDKLDPAHLVRDAQIYVLTARRALEDPVLPLDYRAAVAEARTILTQYSQDAKRRFDLAPVFRLLEELEAAVASLERRIRTQALTPAAAELANLCLMALGRQLIPINYCRSGVFEHDAALPVPPFPGLEPMRRLGRIPLNSDEARQMIVGLVRQRNKVCYHLANALATVRATLGALPSPRRTKNGSKRN
jgi:peptidase M28-like protein